MKKISLLIGINPENEILLQHKDQGAENDAGWWCFFGGSVEDEESPEEAIKREFLEELQVANLKPLFFEAIIDAATGIERHYFYAHIDIDPDDLKIYQLE